MNYKQIISLRLRLTKAYQSHLLTRNTIIDSFEEEFNRHVKLIFGSAWCRFNAKYQAKNNISELPTNHELRVALRVSLKRSRNMKRIQNDLVDTKNRIKQTQIELKNAKTLYKDTLRAMQKEKEQDKPVRLPVESI